MYQIRCLMCVYNVVGFSKHFFSPRRGEIPKRKSENDFFKKNFPAPMGVTFISISRISYKFSMFNRAVNCWSLAASGLELTS